MDERKWRKSSYSGGENNNCVEVAEEAELRLIRDSKDPDGGFFEVPAAGFAALLGCLKASPRRAA
ncbi:DUF397 domain-containing protein [Amycolatopsis sp. NPDC050768]|uniref:DUF397 domain-containing protein n=1 Tax=Amycolatopsis sp. NPDC050768 TaxID=3154839 RepID=UPI0033DD8897